MSDLKNRKTPTGVALQQVVSCASSEREATEGKQDTIVAIKPCCGHVVFAAVNLPNVIDAEIRRDIGELVASGCKIEHWPVESVRKAKWGCKCERS